MSAKTSNGSSRDNRTASNSGQSDISSGVLDRQEPKQPANGQENKVDKKKTVANQRYDSYRKAFYGTGEEKEAYKQQIRSQLKNQVQEKDELHRRQLIDRVAESDSAVANDQKSRLEDNNVKQKKAEYLKQFSNENKKIMEEKEKSTRRTREAETELERNLLTINPINWNMTLH